MTTLASGAPEADRRRRLLPDPLTSLGWVIWRQHRTALIWLAVLVAALGAGILVAGIAMHRLYAAEIAHGCLGRSAWSSVCRPLQTPFAIGWPLTYAYYVVAVMEAVPVIIGVFIGAPLLAREYTAGTVRFTWTQAIGRTRWAVATLVLTGAAVAAVAAVLGLITQWSVQPLAAQTTSFPADRWEPGFFDSTVLTAATAALLAFMIGVLLGALIRRVVYAMAVTGVCAIMAAFSTYHWLDHWLLGQGTRLARDPVFAGLPHDSFPTSGVIGIHEAVSRSVPGPAGAWLDQAWFTGAGGHRLGGAAANQLSFTSPARLTRLHDTFWVTYQPGSRYWVLQLILAGGTLVAALLLAAAAIALIRHRRA